MCQSTAYWTLISSVVFPPISVPTVNVSHFLLDTCHPVVGNLHCCALQIPIKFLIDIFVCNNVLKYDSYFIRYYWKKTYCMTECNALCSKQHYWLCVQNRHSHLHVTPGKDMLIVKMSHGMLWHNRSTKQMVHESLTQWIIHKCITYVDSEFNEGL